MLTIVPEKIALYAEQFTSPETKVLQELNRETHLKVLTPQMLSGHLQGALLTMFSQMIKPKNILEIGTYTGYSAICLCSGLQEGGHLHTIDVNEELEARAKHYFNEAGVAESITMHIGNALEIIPALNVAFDLVFIDADKVNYANYFDLVIDKMPTGGFIVADNVLWNGKVVEDKMDAETAALHEYNQKIHEDARVSNILLPVRDGLMIAQKTV